MMKIFMAHVTRHTEESLSINIPALSLSDKISFAHRLRDRKDTKATKRSYHAMELLTGTTSNHHWMQDSCFRPIITNLLKIFLPHADGNFHHFRKIFLHFVRRHPCDMLDYIVWQNNSTRVFDSIMPFIAHTPVADALLGLLFVRDVNSETEKKRQKAFAQLKTLEWVEWLIEAIHRKERHLSVDGEEAVFSDAAQEMLLRVIGEASHLDHGGILMGSFLTEKGPAMVESLVKLVITKDFAHNHALTISILKALVKCGNLATRASTIAHPVQGPLYAVSIRVQELLLNHIGELSKVIVNNRHSLVTQLCPLTIVDLDLLEVIYQTLMHAQDPTSALDTITPAFWKILVNSFIEKSSSTIYHTFFFRFFHRVLSIGHEPALEQLIRKQRLVRRLIDVYEDKSRPTDNRGFILLILNCLRLTSDADYTSMIHRSLSSHPRYIEFLPTLRSQTLLQTQAKIAWTLASSPRPPPYIGPSPPIRSAPFSPYATTLPLMGVLGVSDRWSSGIDLGSDYAYCLGFDQLVRLEGTETPMDFRSRRNSVHSSSDESTQSDNSRPSSPIAQHHDVMPGFTFESLTSEVAPSKKKKKKKKSKQEKRESL
ncbi:hypothetical protein BDF14DRAFT_1789889 [Spinellus fusiger]|nr:hypothetical protein BDF14DRAFT_1789889 [Spinellus fusiger]